MTMSLRGTMPIGRSLRRSLRRYYVASEAEQGEYQVYIDSPYLSQYSQFKQCFHNQCTTIPVCCAQHESRPGRRECSVSFGCSPQLNCLSSIDFSILPKALSSTCYAQLLA